MTGIPSKNISSADNEKIINLSKINKENVIDQAEYIDENCKSIFKSV